MIARMLLCATTAIVMAPSQPVNATDSARQLSGSEVTRRFPNMELTDEAHWAYVFARTGKLTLYSMGKKTTGQWHVASNKLCMSEGPSEQQQCYSAWSFDSGLELRPDQETSPPLFGVLMKQRKHDL